MNNENEHGFTSWYTPLARDKDLSDIPAEAPKKKRVHVGWRILLGTLLVLGLITGSSMWFSGHAAKQKPAGSSPGRIWDRGFNFLLPDDFPLPDGVFDLPDSLPDSEEDDMPEDWKDFFSEFYTVQNKEREASRIQTVKTRPDWELKLEPADGKEMSLQEIYRSCAESIVGIRSYEDGHSGYYWGTGIILSEDGLILSNAHLVEGCDSAKVTLHDDTEYEAQLVGEDSRSDLVILKIDAKGLVPAVFGDSDALSVGDKVAAIGNPLGEEFLATLTDGIISAIDRGVDVDGHSMNLLQTNTAINEGNSGGALLNVYGQVIGVTNMKMMSNYSSIEGIGFAIPSSTVRMVVNALIREGEVRGRPAIGITVGAVPKEAAEHYELPDGLYVSQVTEGTDAWKKGIREGDIITEVNGEPARTTNDILKIRDTLQVGDSITFTIWREGDSFDMDVVVGDMNDIY